MKTYTVTVRALCEVAAKQGYLDLRFTPSPTSQQGIAGHQSVASNRSASYRRELTVSGVYRRMIVRARRWLREVRRCAAIDRSAGKLRACR